MRRLFALVAASAFFLGLASTAVAAPIIVTYALAPGGTAWYNSVAIPGTPGTGNAGGQMVIVYTSGQVTLGGTLGTVASMKGLQLAFTTPATILAGAVVIPGMGVGNGAPGNVFGGAGTFPGFVTYVPAGYFSPAQPAINGTGTITFVPLGPLTVLINGLGGQVVALPFTWTLGFIVGQEISRVVPEPGTAGLLLLGGLAGLAMGVWRLRR